MEIYDRWTVRGVSTETVDMLREVAYCSGITFGEALNEAVAVWYAGLPEEAEVESDVDQPLDPSVVRRVWFVHDPVFEEISELPSDSSDPDTKRPSGSQRLATRT